MDDMNALVIRSRTLEADFKQHGADTARCADAHALLQDVARAGSIIAKLEDRLLLRGILDYWASVLRIAASAADIETREVIVAPPLAAFNGQGSESDDPLTRISLDEFQRLIDRKALITTKRLSKVTVPPPARPASLKVSAMDSQFFDCTLSQVRFADGSRFITTSFIKCRMDDIVARQAVFIECRFDRSNLDGADFRESDFTQALFTGVLFNERTHFLKANFTYAKLQEVHGSYVTFTQANMNTVELLNAQLMNCQFDRAELTGARLWRSDFRGSNFSGASLREVDVDGASFVNCNLEGANFEGARNIERADFTGSTWREAKFDPIVTEALEARYGVIDATARVADEIRANEQVTEAVRAIDGAPSDRSGDDPTREIRLQRMVIRLRRARSVDGICRSFSACVEELTKSGYNQVFLTNRNGENHGQSMLRVRGEYIDSHKYPSAHRYDVANMDGVIGRALKARQATLVDDVQDDADYIMVEPATHSELALPIMHPELHTVLGVVNIEHQEVAAFPVSIREDLQSLVAVLAVQLVRLIDMGSQSTS